MSEDSELERLKARRLAEMQDNLKQQEDPAEAPRQVSPRDRVVEKLGYRGLEVLENAEAQFPRETALVIAKLAELVQYGELDEVLDGGNLLALFRAVGMRVRMQNKINVVQDGKTVSLSERINRAGARKAGGAD